MKKTATQDELYEYMQQHDLKMTRLAELIGKSDDIVTSCFKHHNDWHGRPRRFNAEHIAAINAALPVIANELEVRQLQWGTDEKQLKENSWGRKYDKALVGQLKDLGKYLNLTGLLMRVLGWTKGKKNAVMSQPNGPAFGTISQEDMKKINNELASIVNDFNNYELLYEDSSSSSSI